MAVYMLDYYLPMLSPNEGYNETGLTMQSAGPIREPWQSIEFEFLFKGSEFGHWRVKGGRDAVCVPTPELRPNGCLPPHWPVKRIIIRLTR